MTPKERAEKILSISQEQYGSECLAKITAEIEEAQREAVQFSSMVAVDMVVALNKEFKAGFAAAKKQAAEIVKEKYFMALSGDCMADEWLAAEIEKMEVKP